MALRTKRSDAFESQIDDLLTYMSLSRPECRQFDQIESRYFDGAEPHFSEFIEARPDNKDHIDGPELSEAKELVRNNPHDGIAYILGDMSPALLRRPTDYALIQALIGNHKFQLTRVRQITTSQIRGKLSRQCQVGLRVSRVIVQHDGTWLQSIHNYLGWSFGSWYPERGCWSQNSGRSNQNIGFNKYIHDELVMVSRVAICGQKNADEAWRVLMGWEGYPRLTFVTDAVGVREVFRLRDMPNGKARRTALRHWVSEHLRQTSDVATESKVRAHMRGATEFYWNGLSCKIIPAIDDRQRNLEPIALTNPLETPDAELVALFGSDGMAVDPAQPRTDI